jgi:deoxyribodipyrimidine photo-lyase
MSKKHSSDNTAPPAILWFRQDLRLSDNPALVAACKQGRVLPVYIHDTVNAGDWQPGEASRWWLHQSLAALNRSLNDKLWLFAGDPREIIPRLMHSHGATTIYWNRCYEPWQTTRDKELKASLEDAGFDVCSHNGALLWEPWENLKNDGTPYKVFTPFYRNAIQRLPQISSPLPAVKKLDLVECEQGSDRLDHLQLLPSVKWYSSLSGYWQPGESGAESRLHAFLKEGLQNYKNGRDYPSLQAVSRISPHLHFGEVSPRQLWHAAGLAGFESGSEEQSAYFQRELAWREFSISLLYHFPDLTRRNMNQQFDAFPWRHEAALLQAWQRGKTGYPLVDAGMRELWQTGYMHNRVRMVVGSFLVKNLRHHWLDGARWFWDCLLDADLANNTCSWQWVAGCGADAAPYFRIFNPVTQSRKFDACADYIREFVPELSKLPDKYIHEPSSAPADVLEAAGVSLGQNYPSPLVDLKTSREEALNAYRTLKEQGK